MTTTPSLNMFIPITKVDQVNRLVYGMATAELPDRSNEICDYETTKPYYEKWSEGFAKATTEMGVETSLGNLRAMHNKVSAGVLKQLNFDDQGKKIEICAKVTDDNEWGKVLEGNYTGFSQGGGYIKRWADPSVPGLIRYTANPSEISLVDLPCLAEATFMVVKDNGETEMRKFINPTPLGTLQTPPVAPAQQVEPEDLDSVEQVWKAKDGTTFKKKADALEHNKKLDNEAQAAAIAKAVQDTIAPTLDAINQATDALNAVSGLSTEDVIKTAGAYLNADDEMLKKIADWPAPMLGYFKQLTKRDFTKEERKEAASKGQAMSDGSFPIINEEDLHNAVWLVGNASDPEAAKAHIIKRAKEMGLTNALPDDWKVEKVQLPATTENGKLDGGGVTKLSAVLKSLGALKSLSEALKAANTNPHTTDEVKKASADARQKAFRKHLLDVGRIASIICELKWLAEDLEWESMWEGDESMAPDALKAIMAQLCNFLKLLVEEETCEMTEGSEDMDGDAMEMAVGIRAHSLHKLLSSVGAADTPILKVLAAIVEKGSKANAIHMQAAHDHIAAAMDGDCCGMEKGNTNAHGQLQVAHDILSGMGAGCMDISDDEADEATGKKHLEAFHQGQLKKGSPFSLELQKAIGAQIMPALEALTKRIKAIEDQPLPAKGVTRIMGLDKVHDTGAGGSMTLQKSDDELRKALEAMTPEELNLLIMKMTLRQGKVLST